MSRSYIVVAADMVTPTVLVLTLYHADKRRPITYRPGQYATMSFKRHGRPTPARCFSLTSDPLDRGWLQFGLRIEGNFTQAAAKHIKVGDTVTIDGPFGGFVLSPARDKIAVMMAGGIGITPFMSMIRNATKLQLDNQILLVYSSKTQDDVPFANELMQLEQANPNLHVVFTISTGPLSRFAGHRAVQGRVTPELLGNMLGGYYREKTFFICGPPPFMKSMTEELHRRHVTSSRIMTEVFSQSLPNEEVWIGQPSQIYALTALSMLLGIGVVTDHDFRTVLDKQAAQNSGGYVRDTKNTDTASSREQAIDQTIGDLITVGSDAETETGGPMVVGNGGQTPASSSSGSRTSTSSSSGSRSTSSSSSGSSSGTRTTSPTPSSSGGTTRPSRC